MKALLGNYRLGCMPYVYEDGVAYLWGGKKCHGQGKKGGKGVARGKE